MFVQRYELLISLAVTLNQDQFIYFDIFGHCFTNFGPKY